MGTSTSSKGPGNNSPLVPPWADVDGMGPGPQPDANRFRGFRRSLGRFVDSGDPSHLTTALGRYARSSTGGATVGPRRFGAMAQVGGALFGVLDQLRTNPSKAPVNLRALSGRPTREAIDAIVEALVPPNGDAERIRSALNEALSECLDGVQTFDFGDITDELLVEVMIAYVARCVFEQIVLDSDRAFGKATSADQLDRAEKGLLELVKVAADKHMRPLLDSQIQGMTDVQIRAAELAAIQEVWKEWEAYEP